MPITPKIVKPVEFADRLIKPTAKNLFTDISAVPKKQLNKKRTAFNLAKKTQSEKETVPLLKKDGRVTEKTIENFESRLRNNELFTIRKNMKRPRPDSVKVNKAKDLINEMKKQNFMCAKGEQLFAVVSGNFIMSDFLEQFFELYNFYAYSVSISSLAASTAGRDVDTLSKMLDNKRFLELELIFSDVFHGSCKSSGLLPYMYEKLDRKNGLFQLSFARTHVKTILIETVKGSKIVINGSANLNSSRNIEFITIEQDADLYDFMKQIFDNIHLQFYTVNDNKDMFEGESIGAVHGLYKDFVGAKIYECKI
jgi:hypothetical protein